MVVFIYHCMFTDILVQFHLEIQVSYGQKITERRQTKGLIVDCFQGKLITCVGPRKKFNVYYHPINEGKAIFSVVSVCSQGVTMQLLHVMPLLSHRCHGNTQSWPHHLHGDLTIQGPPSPDMFKLVQHGPHRAETPPAPCETG